ncbi:MAG TPA: flagellar basal-body rod protein FlgG [Treponemataceae bacterium]|jgi:flagellar basal-body rod protein FlgG|nr:flagellar basal-body rod protein FlgG [Treponema sp.]OQB04704.1 MAG: Flagellar basal-body rod protein FlgG [Spirochaetes bacterium ADurb.Bin215]HOF84672.1 flagellar basal-body rod protein FlgG [Treponemataceae bacterium]HOS34925.1 flagellar basal-body rod protein FlgG [Treponemataceae bacterium]HOU38909.1 flagellar basal-body rod protein FlgG [Treponemataceae bacterium]
MVRSLWTAATGMNGQQTNIDTIANNLSNVNTTGFKKQRAEFEDLLYQTIKTAGTPATEDTITPVGVQMGHGVKVAATLRMFDQGSLQNTGNISDLAVQGEGFFRVLQYDGTYAYTRDGAFKIDSERQLVTSGGLKVLPEITFPEGYRQETLSISQDGRVTVKVGDLDDPVDVGQLELYRFHNPAGLSATGDNLFKQTPASGNSIAGRPGFEGFGKTIHKFLEMSNVSTVAEMVNMIVAQRAYEFNSKAIQTSDNMLQTAASLKR